MFFTKKKDADLYRKIEEIRTHRKYKVVPCLKPVNIFDDVKGYTLVLVTNENEGKWKLV